MKKAETKKLLQIELENYRASLSKDNTNDIYLHNKFRERLSRTEKKLTPVESFFTHSKKYFLIGAPLFLAGFMLARLTIPLSVGVKGMDNELNISHISTTTIETVSDEKFDEVVTHSVRYGVNFEYTMHGTARQIYITGLQSNNHFGLKKLLGFESDFEGPVTLIND